MLLNYVRTPRVWMNLFFYLVAGGAWAASAQPVKDAAADVAALRAEVQRLSLELLQHRAEFIQWKMHWIRAELEQVQAERQRLKTERQLVEREIGDLSLALTNNPGAEDQERREELNTVQTPALLAGERAATARETTLVAALNAESAHLAEIQKQLQRLPVQSPKQR